MAPLVRLPPPVFINKPFFGTGNAWCPGLLPPSPDSPSLEQSIRRVMASYGARDLYGPSLLPSYRSLRRRRADEENQAVAVTHENNCYKVMIDVREFSEGSLSVRAVDEDELVVEGTVEKRESLSPSEMHQIHSSSSKKFQQRFVFPGLQLDAVTSFVSSDGVLTILAPSKPDRNSEKEISIPVVQEPAVQDSPQVGSVPSGSQGYDLTQQLVISSKPRELIVPIEVEEQSAETEKADVKSSVPSKISSNFGSKSDSFALGKTFIDSKIDVFSKGPFFADSFFANSRRHFEDAVKKVFERVSDSDSVADHIDWYKTYRAGSSVEDHRAGSIVEDNNEFKVVLDVKDFSLNSVSVKVIGENELLVKGEIKKSDEGNFVQRSFMKRFILPGTIKSHNITSALSEDGILTITAPKCAASVQCVELKGDDASMTTKELIESSTVFDQNTSSPTPSEMIGPFDPVYSQTTAPNFPIVNASTSIEMKDTSNMKDSPVAQKNENLFANPGEKIIAVNFIEKNQSEIDAEAKKESERGLESSNQFQLIGTVKDLTDRNVKETLKERKSSSNKSSRDVAIRFNDPSQFSIVRRGPFYQDSIFDEVRNHFQRAMRSVLDRWAYDASLFFGDSGALSNFDKYHNTFSNYSSILDRDIFDDFACYKTLRHRSRKEENQVASLTDNGQSYKIVLDVHGFSEKDLSIQAIAHNILVVEGKMEHCESGAVSVNQFKRQFVLPEPVKMENVYSALSVDDVLTITVPKNEALPITG